MIRLLSIDWDYFFPIPDSDPHGFYDWGHREAPFFMGPAAWVTREASFLAAGQKRPDVLDDWKTFWDQFTIAGDADMYYGESHSWAVHEDVAEGVTEVWSYDAHHDLSYSLPNWSAAIGGEYDCGSWLVHYAKQMPPNRIHVRYPWWMGGREIEEPNYHADVDVKVTSKLERTPTFDRVFVCRSGAWTPAWCDEKYSAFVDLCPVRPDQRTDLGLSLGWSSHPRPYDPTAVTEVVMLLKEIRKDMKK